MQQKIDGKKNIKKGQKEEKEKEKEEEDDDEEKRKARINHIENGIRRSESFRVRRRRRSERIKEKLRPQI